MGDEITPITATTLAKVEASNLPAAQKSSIRRLYERVRGGGTRMYGQVKSVAGAGVRAVKVGGEGLVTGGAIAGLEHVQNSSWVPNALKNVPVAPVVGAVGLLGSVVLHAEEFSGDMATVGAVGLGIYARDEMGKFLAGHPATMHGESAGQFYPGATDDIGEDPIVKKARSL